MPLDNVVCLIQGSVAIPNSCGLPSLILEDAGGRPLLSYPLSAVNRAESVSRVIFVTSDSCADDKLIEAVENSLPDKIFSVLRISGDKKYSFFLDRSKVRYKVFPITFRPAVGIFNLEGFSEILREYNLQDIILFDLNEIFNITPGLLDTIAANIKGEVLRFRPIDNAFEITGMNVSYFLSLAKKYKGKVEAYIKALSKEPVIDDIFRFSDDFDAKPYIATRSMLRGRYFSLPVLRRQELRLVKLVIERKISEENVDYMDIFTRPLFPNYVELDGEIELDGEAELFLNSFSFSGIALKVKCGKIDFDKVSNISSRVKKYGDVSVWLESAEFLNTDEIEKLTEAGVDLYIFDITKYRGEKDKIVKSVEDMNSFKAGSGKIFPALALLYKVDAYLRDDENEWLRTFDSMVDRIVIMPNYFDLNGNVDFGRGINFSPLRRVACRRILDGFSIFGRGEAALCEYNRDGIGGIGNTDGVASVRKKVILAHNALDFMPGICRECTEWYIQPVEKVFQEISTDKMFDFLAGVKADVEILPENFALKEKCLALLSDLDKRRSFLDELYFSYIDSFRREKYKVTKSYSSCDSDVVKKKMEDIVRIKEVLASFLIRFADVYIRDKKYGEALELLENILKNFPSDSYAVKLLDRIELEISS